MIDAENLTRQWYAKNALSREDIADYLKNNLDASAHLTDDELAHVVDLMHSLVCWSIGERAIIGDFLTAIVENQLDKAAMYADGTNKRALWLYPMFLYNVAPIGWKDLR